MSQVVIYDIISAINVSIFLPSHSCPSTLYHHPKSPLTCQNTHIDVRSIYWMAGHFLKAFLALSTVDLDTFYLLEWRSSEFKLLNQVQNDEIQLTPTAVEYVYTEAIDCSVCCR